MPHSISCTPAPDWAVCWRSAQNLCVLWARELTALEKFVMPASPASLRPTPGLAGCWPSAVNAVHGSHPMLRYPCSYNEALDLIPRKVVLTHPPIVSFRQWADLANLAASGNRCASSCFRLARVATSLRRPFSRCRNPKVPRTTAPLCAIAALAR